MLLSYLKEQNTWWDKGSVNKKLLGRPRSNYLELLKEEVNNNRIVALSGIRRSGKTTLLFQLMSSLLAAKTNPQRILYFKIDDLDQDYKIEEILNIYQEITGLDFKRSRVFVFIDEIQYLKNWQRQLKRWLDAKLPIKFFVTGSSVLLLYRQASESLVGRIHFMPIYPLTFPEFLEFNHLTIKSPKIDFSQKTFFKKIEQVYKDNILAQRKIKYFFNQYLEIGGFPEWFEVKDREKWRRILRDEYFALIIYKDITKTFKIKDPLLLEHLIKEIAHHSSERFSYLSLANKLDADKETIKLYIYYLRSALLISMFEVYSKTRLMSERKEKKLLFWEEGMRKALTGRAGQNGHSLENVVSWHLSILNPVRDFNEGFYWKNKAEVDFVLERDKTTIPVEIKLSAKQESVKLKGLIEFMDKFNSPYGLVVYQGNFALERVGKKPIYFVPAWWLLAGL